MRAEPPTIAGLEGLAANYEVGPHLAEPVRYRCGLSPDDQILEVGCGIGRVAVPLTRCLSDDGASEALDIVSEAVTWCTESITSAEPNFRFRHTPVRNDRYNPTGVLQDSEYEFASDDASFDIVILMSVFTHRLPAGDSQYVSEIARVLRPRGHALITMFLPNAESDRLRVPASAFAFPDDRGVCAIQTLDPPEAAVAYREAFGRAELARAGLELEVCYGSWCGRDTTNLQDRIVAMRP